jgi:hypothetical protein|tara:strand:+ start:2510 stop:2719 length:210 start_codon:yes stop_codon:yes gene_type:complete
MNEEDKKKIKEYSKKTPLYLSRRKFDSDGTLTDVKCSNCSEFKPLGEYSKNKVEIDGIDHKCRVCKVKK